jgi:hypothetical protein
VSPWWLDPGSGYPLVTSGADTFLRGGVMRSAATIASIEA